MNEEGMLKRTETARGPRSLFTREDGENNSHPQIGLNLEDHNGNQHLNDSPSDIYAAGSGPEAEQRARLLAPKIDELNLRAADDRRKSFRLNHYGLSEDVDRLIENGFFCNIYGALECFCCHFSIWDWSHRANNITELHKQSSRRSNCRFLKGEDCGNIPFSATSATNAMNQSCPDSSPMQHQAQRRPNSSNSISDPLPFANLNTPPRTQEDLSSVARPTFVVNGDYVESGAHKHVHHHGCGNVEDLGSIVLTPPHTPQRPSDRSMCRNCNRNPVNPLPCQHNLCEDCFFVIRGCPHCLREQESGVAANIRGVR